MINRYRAVRQRINLELDELEKVVETIQQHWQSSKTSPDASAFINSVALNLHSFYSGLERIFEFIATDIDGIRLGGDRWHTELLQQMMLDMPDVRPTVLSRPIVAQLDNYRKFRHLVRNVYTRTLKPDELEKLVMPLPVLWAEIREQLAAFGRYLDQMAHADE